METLLGALAGLGLVAAVGVLVMAALVASDAMALRRRRGTLAHGRS